MKKYLLLLFIMTGFIWCSAIKLETDRTYKEEIEKILSQKYDTIVWDSAKKPYKKGKKYFKEKDYKNALKYFIDAAKEGHKDSLYYLVYLVYHGKGISPNTELAFKLYLRLYRETLKIQDFPLVWVSDKGEKALPFEKNKQMLFDEAKKKNPDAFIQLGNAYKIGAFGFKKDKQRSLKWYIQAMKQNDITGLIQAGYLCNEGIGGKQECEVVYDDIKKEANKGNSSSFYIMGKYYYKKKEFEKAKKWLLKAAAQHSLNAQDLLAEMDIYEYIIWEGAEKYLLQYGLSAKFKKKIIKAIRKGSARAAYYLGKYYHEKFENEKALKYLKIAAENGDSRAYYPLAIQYIYSHVRGSRNDLHEGVKWLEKAKKNKSHINISIIGALLDAYLNLAELYAKEGNIEKKKKYEYKLFNTAGEGARLGIVQAQVIFESVQNSVSATIGNINATPLNIYPTSLQRRLPVGTRSKTSSR